MLTIIKIHRVPLLVAAVCVALAISAPFAAAYVATDQSAARIETNSQIDRSNKTDRLHVSPQQKPVERAGVKRIEPPKRLAAPHMVA
jgi:hypothetical protein